LAIWFIIQFHKTHIFAALEYGSAAFGSASTAQLKRLEPVHNKGLRIALGAFCVCRTENIMCELTWSLEVDLDMVESATQLEHPPWIGDNMENVNIQMTAIPKGTATARIKAEMEQTIKEEGLEEYVRVYTDGLLMGDRLGCAIICEAIRRNQDYTAKTNVDLQHRSSSHSGSNKSHKKMGECQKKLS
jgi:hypothetical protein